MKKKILVVDDQSGIRLLLQSFFIQKGYDVVVASNGLEGVRLTQAQEIDFAVIDMMMPIMDGVSMIEQLSKENRLMPCVLMTAYGEAERAAYALTLGAHAVISKPFDMDDIYELVQEMTELKITP